MNSVKNSFNPTFLIGNKMPREQRDTLFILAVLTFILIPHFLYLPIWATILSILTLLWRAWLSKDPAKKLPSRTIRVVLLALFVGLTLFSFKSITGPEAGGCLLVMLVSLKTLELRARRDAMVIFYLGFFLIMMGFFQSQNIPTALGLLLGLTALLAALINAHMPVGTPPLKDAFRIAVRLMLWGTPLMVVLFMTFPRLDPLWGLPDSALTKTGVSDELTINSISRLVQNSAIAFRVKFDGRAPEMKNMYFRGPVLSLFNGTTWRSREVSLQGTLKADEWKAFFDYSGSPIVYEVTMESTNQPWLFTLDLTVNSPELSNHRAYMSGSLQWLSSSIISERIRYKAQAYLNYHAGAATLNRWLLQLDTQLPEGSNPRTQAWATELMQTPQFAGLDARGKAQWLMNYIRTKEYFYTFSPPAGYNSANAADQLWFDYRAGFCEHYAFSFAILMRSMGIPARIVTGYQGAEENFVDGYWIVRQSNAHAWTEIWQRGEGWIRVDPTAAIAPYRIENGSLDQNTTINLGRGFEGMGIMNKLMMRWDALENSWNQWVLAYTVSSGIDLLERIGFKSPNWFTLIKVLLGILASITGCVLLISRWRSARKDQWSKAYNSLRKKLQHAGYASDDTTGPRTLAQSIATASTNSPALKQAQQILLKLEKIRYAPSSSEQDKGYRRSLNQIKRAIQQLHIS